MKLKKLITAAAVLAAMSFGATSASADTSVKAVFDGIYSANTNSCYICHTSDDGSSLIAYGLAYAGAGGPKTANNATDIATATTAFATIDATYTTQIANSTLPDAAPATTTATSSSGGGCVTASITTPLTMVLAMLTLGFFVRRKKD